MAEKTPVVEYEPYSGEDRSAWPHIPDAPPTPDNADGVEETDEDVEKYGYTVPTLPERGTEDADSSCWWECRAPALAGSLCCCCCGGEWVEGDEEECIPSCSFRPFGDEEDDRPE